jgi:RimJ/RimL family protein N-acetyltransferase/ribosomal protein S18 acetylase RimI-like enzyme
MFTPIRTERLLIRPFQVDDAVGLAERRNDPEVARYQDWSVPYPMDLAETIVLDLVAMDGPQNDEWWMAVVCDIDTGEVFGDLALHLEDEARTAEVGYTFAREQWGNGFAVEALGALVEYLFDDLGVTRIFGMLHPNNPASAMVLERTGFLFEGHTKSSFWEGDEVSDDWIYGLIRRDWEIWCDRPQSPPIEVSLVEVTVENERMISNLRTHMTQESMVAPVGRSFTDALFPEVVNGAPLVPWMRGIVADDEMVGFVMLALSSDHHPEPYLWRLLIDRLHQRRGIGGRVLDLIAGECKAMGDTALLTSWVEGKGSPRPVYERHGFKPTGNILGGETEGRWTLV